MKYCCLFLLAFLISIQVIGQAPSIIWQNAIGGSANDYGFSIIQTADGGYLTTAITFSSTVDVTGYHGNGDIWVVKLNASGTLAWQKCLGGTLQDGESTGVYIAQNDVCGLQGLDGNYYIMSSVKSNDGDVSGNHGNFDIWLVKLSPTGSVMQQRCIGGIKDDFGKALVQTADGGFVIAGETKSSGSGDITTTTSYGNFNGLIIKVDAALNPVWNKIYGGNHEDGFYSIAKDGDALLVAGITTSNDGDIVGYHGSGHDTWLVKCDGNGNSIWTNCYGSNSDDLYAREILKIPDGYLVMATTGGNSGDVSNMHYFNGDIFEYPFDIWLLKLDFAGNIIWQKPVGTYYIDKSGGIATDAAGNIYVAGSVSETTGMVNHVLGNGDMWIAKFNPTADFIYWEKTYGSFSDDQAGDMIVNAAGDLVVIGLAAGSTGDVTGVAGGYDEWVVKMDEPAFTKKIITHFEDALLYCPGADITTGFEVTAPFNPGNIFTLQLSDENGSFTAPLNLATLNATTGGSITAELPSIIGVGYRVRIIGSDPASTGTDNGDDFRLVCKDPVLASAIPGANEIHLKWHPAVCSNAYRVSYRSVTGGSWTTVNVTDTLYTISGLTPLTSYYYRIKTVCDNTPLIESNWEKGTQTTTGRAGDISNQEINVELFPNPAHNFVQMHFLSGTNAETIIRIIDLSGNVIKNIPVEIKSGLNDKTIHMEELPAGIYCLQIALNGQLVVKKIIVE